MADKYRIIGAEMSPYSVKVRSYFRYKGLPHQWVLRNAASQAEYEKHARVPIIPLVVTPDGTGIQDSTPIIDRIKSFIPNRRSIPATRSRNSSPRWLKSSATSGATNGCFTTAGPATSTSAAPRPSHGCAHPGPASRSLPLWPNRCGSAWWSGFGSLAPTRPPRRRSRPASWKSPAFRPARILSDSFGLLSVAVAAKTSGLLSRTYAGAPTFAFISQSCSSITGRVRR